MENKNISWPGWETGKLIGRGSFGAVYEIQRDIFGTIEKAALKVISIPQNASDIDEMYSNGYDEESITSTFKSHLQNIVEEYTLMRKMNGSLNVVNCEDIRYVQHDDGIGWDIFIKMELLTPLIKSLPAEIPEATVIKIAKDLCAALVLCKKHGIVHRDIKPQNIFVSPDGNYKLGDFGIAKVVEKTTGGTKIGTYNYMAPEVYNNQPYGHAVDIYSLGLVLYWMLNGRRMPFLPLPPVKLSAGMDEQARHRRLSGEPLPPPAYGSEKLKQIILKACAANPRLRYQSAQEMLDDLESLQFGGVSTVSASNVVKTQSGAAGQSWSEDATIGMMAHGVAANNGDLTCSEKSRTSGQVWDENATVGMGFRQITTDSHQTVDVQTQTPKKNICSNCGSELQDDQQFCTQCGRKAGQGASVVATKKPETFVRNTASSEPTRKKSGLVIGIVAAVLVAAIGLMVVLMGSKGDSTENSGSGKADHCSENGHDWVAADCTSPKTCGECGETLGAALGHSWTAGDCTNPKTCVNCGASQGSASGHSWTSATCTSPKICSNCGATEGTVLDHNWIAATCTAPKVCSNCDTTEGTVLDHNWIAATCTAPKVCSNCGTTEGTVLDHNWIAATCTAPKTCSSCGQTTGQAAEHDWAAATTTKPKTCRSCGATEGKPTPDIVAGDVITMGHYGNQDIEWIVLEFDPSTNQALVISKYCLEAIPFHTGTGSGTWENCTLRKWLNNNFISTAFSEEERAIILTAHLTTNDNADYGTESGNDTYDRVFLLSYDEAVYYFPSQTSRQGTPTAYCKAQGCYDPVKYAEEHGETVDPAAVGHTWWWLRTAGRNENSTCNVVAKGTASTYGANKSSNEGTIRPAMWIQFE